MISLEQACVDFYAMQVIDIMKKKRDAKFVKLKKDFTRQLAQAMSDYLVLACAGEARHGKGSCTKYITDIKKPDSRDKIWQVAREYSPLPLMRKCSTLFNRHRWAGGYGGKKWGQCAQAFIDHHDKTHMLYKDTLYVDYCFDLQHNNGTVFNKGANIFNSIYGLQTILDTKRDSEEALFSNFEVSPQVIYFMLSQGVEGLPCKVLGDNSKLLKVLNYEPIQWGTKLLKDKFGVGSYNPCRERRNESESEEEETERPTVVSAKTRSTDTVQSYPSYGADYTCETDCIRELPQDAGSDTAPMGIEPEPDNSGDFYDRGKFIARCIKLGIR